MYHRFLQPPPVQPTELLAQDSWGLAQHLWSQPEFDALAVAGFSGRPLLVRGEPGVGKSQLARAAAAELKWRFDYEVITPRFEPQDLLWRFDAMRRLAAAHGGQVEDELPYVTPGVLWRALDPAGSGQADQRPCVVLIDEIDKADTDLANSLLEVLGNRGFKTPWGQVPAQGQVAAAGGPLFIISSNNERELPLAFLRRCAVLELVVPDEAAHPAEFEAWLLARGRAQFASLGDAVLTEAATRVRQDRLASPEGQGARPGLAEYLDLLRAIHEVTQKPSPEDAPRLTPAELMRRMAPYVLRKQGQPQQGGTEGAAPPAYGGSAPA